MDEFYDSEPLTPSGTGTFPRDAQPASTTGQSHPVSYSRSSYTRQHTPRRTVEAINDLEEDDNPTIYTHESDIAVGGMMQEGSYRRARAQVSQFKKNNRYGQYLQVPKGRRSIFAKQERKRRRQSALAAIVVIGLLAAIAYLIWQVMSNLSFGNLILGERTVWGPAQILGSLTEYAKPLVRTAVAGLRC